MRKKNPARKAFTLIELLAVMGIMAMIVVAVVANLNGMTRGAGLSGATFQVRTALSQARQWAITHRVKTYVVFPTASTNWAYRGYCIWTATDGFISEWQTLPNNVVFAALPSGSPNVMTPWGADTWNLPPTGASNAVGGACYSVMFRPDGSSTGVGDVFVQPTIYLAEGVAPTNAASTPWYRPNGGTNGVQISSMAGRIQTI